MKVEVGVQRSLSSSSFSKAVEYEQLYFNVCDDDQTISLLSTVHSQPNRIFTRAQVLPSYPNHKLYCCSLATKCCAPNLFLALVPPVYSRPIVVLASRPVNTPTVTSLASCAGKSLFRNSLILSVYTPASWLAVIIPYKLATKAHPVGCDKSS
jgi:hypothetical protein